MDKLVNNVKQSYLRCKNNLEKNDKLAKVLIVIVILLLPVMLVNRYLDGDTWFLLNSGRYIMNNGLYTTEPFTIHEGYKFIFQQWLTDVIFWNIYNIFGKIGLIVYIMIQVLVLNIICYKLFKMISNNSTVSLIGVLLVDYMSQRYFVTRPQVSTMISIVLFIYILEKYCRNNKITTLLFLLPVSILEINLHSSIWWILLVFTMPYIFDLFSIKKLGIEGDKSYNKRNIIIMDILILLSSLINPYGIQAPMYLFKSMGSEYKRIIMELQPSNLNDDFGRMFIALILFALIRRMYLSYNKEKEVATVKLRYMYMLVGTAILFLDSSRSIVFLAIGAGIYTVHMLRKMRKNNAIIATIGITVILLGTINITHLILTDDITNTKGTIEEDIEPIKDWLVEHVENPSDTRVYTGFNEGGYLEFYGFRCYIDARMEVMLKSINEVADTYDEYCKAFYEGTYNDIFDKYDFDYYVIEKQSKDYQYIKLDSNYCEVTSSDGYALYIKASDIMERYLAND